jgi:hypothetical protein
MEATAQAWAPIAVELARAGWRPITNAVADPPKVNVERFGDRPMLFTVRNTSDEPVTATVTIRGEWPFCDARYPRRVPDVQVDDGLTRVMVEIPPREMEYLRVAREREHVRSGGDATDGALDLLKDAPPVSIVIPEQPSDAMERMARRVRGFVLVQAELLEQEPEVEIARGEANATHPDRVIIEDGVGPVQFEVRDEHTTVLRFSDETRAIHALSDRLDTIAVPLTDDPPKWVP